MTLRLTLRRKFAFLLRGSFIKRFKMPERATREGQGSWLTKRSPLGESGELPGLASVHFSYSLLFHLVVYFIFAQCLQ